MLDHFTVFTRGGIRVWTWSGGTPLRGAPLDALVRGCLVEDRPPGGAGFIYAPPGGCAAPYTVKWALDNSRGLVFAAVHQAALRLPYVDALLDDVKAAFSRVYAPQGAPGAPGRVVDGAAFDGAFARLLARAERAAGGGGGAAAAAAAVIATAPPPAPRTPAPAGNGGSTGGEAPAKAAADDDDGGARPAPPGAAFDLAKVKKRAGAGRGGGRGGGGGGGGPPPGLGGGGGGGAPPPGLLGPAKKAGKGGRRRGEGGEEPARLDFSDPAPTADAAGLAGAVPTVDLSLKSRVDEVDDVSSSDDDSDDGGGGGGEAAKKSGNGGSGAAAAAAAAAPPGALGSLVRSLGLALAGSASLSAADVSPALDALKTKLMARNVCEPVAAQVCAAVGASLEGTSLASFTGVKATVRAAVEAALTRILTPRRSIDILREVRAAKAAGRPYVCVFVGVNGVGKSTSLAKVAYWLRSNGVSVLIAACDTFRAGAVEQLKTHAARLGVPLFERGYEKDPARVAADAVRAAAREGVDVVLVDTAGRMQDNAPLMRALAGLVASNDPDLVLFVGEALVGGDGVDQLTSFNAKLLELAPPRKGTAEGGGGGAAAAAAVADASAPPAARAGRGCAVDGVLLTKFDTIDDRVGAAVSMVYASGAPVMFVGCGQTYVDLKRLNVRSVVRSLLK